MSGGATRARLPGGRWHLQHGPIDIVTAADGEPAAVARAHEAVWARFRTVLEELVAELPLLRTEIAQRPAVRGAVARRMAAAVAPHGARFITPMAAVAGAVADELVTCFRAEPGVRRAYVNDGGDIALYLAPGQRYRVGLYGDLGRLQRHGRDALSCLDGDFEIGAELPVRGVATSGWRGRSFSLGVADSVTVLAADGASADAAATMIANAVDVDDPRVERRPASAVADDTDLGDRLVTVHVPPLGARAVGEALDAGASAARAMVFAGLLWGAILVMQGAYRVVGGDGAPRLHPRSPVRTVDRAAEALLEGER